MSWMSVSSIPSIEIGRWSRAIITWSAVRYLSGYATTRSDAHFGFGMSSIAAGAYLLVYFLGNLGMKTVTTPLLAIFGFRNVLDFALSPDGSRVVYRLDYDQNDVFELYSAPADGSAPQVKLNGPLVEDGRRRHGTSRHRRAGPGIARRG